MTCERWFLKKMVSDEGGVSMVFHEGGLSRGVLYCIIYSVMGMQNKTIFIF